MKFGLIRVLTTKNKNLLDSHGLLIERHFPSLKIKSICIQDQPEGIHNRVTKNKAIPKIIEAGCRLAEEDYSGIIVSCGDDPGVIELRKIVNIPVFGAGSSAASLALSYGQSVGTLGITLNSPLAMKEILQNNLVGHVKPAGVATTLDLMTKGGRKNAIIAGESLREKGAEIIVFACTGFSTIDLAPDLEKTVGIPVIDAVIASGLFAWFFIKKRSP
ncbi:aspartate/glutamate racemase family protein [Acidobacteriota bacterium]